MVDLYFLWVQIVYNALCGCLQTVAKTLKMGYRLSTHNAHKAAAIRFGNVNKGSRSRRYPKTKHVEKRISANAARPGAVQQEKTRVEVELIKVRVEEQRSRCQNSNIDQHLNRGHPTQLLFHSIVLHSKIEAK
jgi:hypothetical protein